MLDVVFFYQLPYGNNEQKLERIVGSPEYLQGYMDELKREGCKIISVRELGREVDPYAYAKIEIR